MCQSVISGSLTLRNTKYVVLGRSLIFQKFELSVSCSTFSRQLKTSEIKSERPNRNRGKEAEKQREIAIRNFRDYSK